MTTSQTRPNDTKSLTRLDRERESNESVKNTVILYAIIILLTNRLGGIYMALSHNHLLKMAP